MAEELRVKGNAAFTAQKYEEAIKLYDEALLIDPRSVDTLNNRSAANFSLRRLDAAVEDARRSIKVSSNSKGFLRLGNALWQQGKLEQAKDAYDLALSAAPNNQTAKDNLAAIRQILASRAGNSGNAGSTQAGNTQHGASSQAALYLDLLIVALAVVHIVALFISGAMSSLAWRGVLATFAGRQGLTLQAAGLLAPNMDTLKKWPSHFSSLYVLLCVVGFVVAIPPLHLLLAAIIMYTIVDISANMNQLQGRIPPVLLDRVNPLLQRAAASREVLIGNAAMSEAMLTFMLFFSGASMMFMMAYLQFIKFRYRSDGYNRMAFGALRQTVERLTRHQLCPPVVDRGFSKLCDLLHRVATG